MQAIWLLALCSASKLVASAASVTSQSERKNGKNGWFVPQIDGTFAWVDKDDAESYLKFAAKMENRLFVNPVKFYLYTRAKPSEGQEIFATKTSINASNFNAKNPTRIIVHGWTSNGFDGLNKGIRTVLFSQGDFNIIAIDWRRARSINYISSVLAIPGVGKKIAELVDLFFKLKGLDFGTLEIIGQSLGAHVAGYAGKNVASGKVKTIVGLDTASPLFNYNEPDKRLCNTDALYVQTIHTNGDNLGFLEPIGSGAFYPNGGISQPGCGIDFIGLCSHIRAATYYIESLAKDNFPSQKCPTYKHAVAKNCTFNYSSVRMGSMANDLMATGNYYVPVNGEAPYGTSH